MTIKSLFGKTYETALLFIFLLELLSLIIFLIPAAGNVFFVLLVVLFFVISMRRPELGLWILIAELIIGSKGYLFSFTTGGLSISIRIAFWIIFMSIWLASVTVKLFKRPVSLNSALNSFIVFKRTKILPYFVVLFIFIAWGVVNGLIHRHGLNNLFFDANGWLYFGLLFPIYSIFLSSGKESKDIVAEFWQIFTAAAVWVALKTIFLLYLFSHNMYGLTSEIYRWVRVTGVGEVTRMEGDFYRIFLQSQIYPLAAFFIFFVLGIRSYFEKVSSWKKELALYLLFASLFLTVVLISFSRSNWVGLAAGLLLTAVFLYILIGWRRLLLSIIPGIGVLAASLAFIAITVSIPWPDPLARFSTTDLLGNRATQIAGEAGASSRWALLPELWAKIKTSPVLGSGFGATVTYFTKDPRILASNPTGEYTTYAFEWGWLDIWLKLGFFGLLAYIILILRLLVLWLGRLKKSYASTDFLSGLFVIGLIAISAVHIFSPYLNHPLGIGYILICAVLYEASWQDRLQSI